MDKFKLFVLSLTLVSLSLLTQGQAQNSFITGSITTSGTTTDCSTAGTCIILAVQRNAGGASININGTFSGTLQFEAATDPAGQNYTAIAMTPLAGGTAVTSATAAGSWTTNASGIVGIRVRASALASGSAQVSIQQSTASANSRSSGSSSGGGGAGSGGAPVVGFYLSPNCPVANTGQCVNTNANTRVDQTATWTSTTGVITATDSPFTSADVGKTAWGYANTHGGCNPYQPAPTVAITATHVTVSTFTDANHITVSANPSQANATTGNGCFIWGTPDDTGAATLWTQVNAATTCPKVTLAAGSYLFTTPPQILYSQPTACANLPFVYPFATSQANMFFTAGYDLEGRGPGTTTLYLPPDFPETGSCSNGRNSNACFAVPVAGAFRQFSVTSGSGNGGMPNAKALFNLDVGTLEGVTCAGVANGSTHLTSIGVLITYWAQLYQTDFSACGSIAYDWDSTTGGGAIPPSVGIRIASENAYVSNYQFENGSAASLYWPLGIGTQDGGATNVEFANKGGTVFVFGGGCAESTGITTGQICWKNTGAAAVNHLSMFDGSGAANNGGEQGMVNTAAAITYMSNSSFLGNGSGKNYSDFAGSILYDLGGNSLTGGGGNTINGTVFGSVSATGTTIVASGITPSTGWGTAGTAGAGVTGVIGSASRMTFTVTAAGSPTPNPTIAIVFPATLLGAGFLIAPSCTALQIGGTGAAGNVTQTTGPSATGLTLTWAGTPAAASTYIFTVICSN